MQISYPHYVRTKLTKIWSLVLDMNEQHLVKQQLYSHLPLISQTIQLRRARYVGNCWRSMDELISDIILWTPTHGHTSIGWLAKIYIHQLCADTEYHLENITRVMTDRQMVRQNRGDLCSQHILMSLSQS